MKVNATASVPRTLIEKFEVPELERFFSNHSVNLRNIKYEPSLIILFLTGTKENLRASVRALHKGATQEDLGVETQVAKNIPESLQQSLIASVNMEEYFSSCKQQGLAPHPELIEGFVY